MREVWDGYQRHLLASVDVKPLSTELTLREGIRAFVTSLERLNCRDRYTKNIEDFLSLFARGREEMRMSEISPQVCVTWFEDRKALARETLKGEKSKLRSWFTWAIHHGYMREGTIECPIPVAPIKLAKTDRPLPAIVTPEQAAGMEIAASQEPTILVFLTLALFCGVRPEEVERLTSADVKLADKMVDVTKSKTRWARLAPIPDNAIALASPRKRSAGGATLRSQCVQADEC